MIEIGSHRHRLLGNFMSLERKFAHYSEFSLSATVR